MRRLFVAALVFLAACESDPSLNITIVADSNLSASQVLSLRTLVFAFSGAESAHAKRMLSERPFGGGQERVVYKPDAVVGDMLVEVSALDSDGAVVASGSETAHLKSSSVPVSIHLGAGSNGIVLTQSQYDFGSALVGTASAPAEFTLTNQSDHMSGVPAFSFSDSSAHAFVIGTNGCDSQALGPGKSCTLTVMFDSSTAGSVGDVLTAFAVPGGTTSSKLVGAAVLPGDLSLDLTNKDFGTLKQGDTSLDTVITVTNNGTAATGPLQVVLGGSDASSFGLGASDCANQALPPSGKCRTAVHFSPTSGGRKGASLLIGGVPGGSAVASLSGASLGAAALSTMQTTVDFGAVVVGQPSIDLPVTISNSGAQPSGVPTLVIDGADAADFGLSMDGCSGAPIAGGNGCSVKIHFSPSSAGMKSANLAIAASPGGTVQVKLLGSALAPGNLQLTPSTHDYMQVVQGQSKEFGFTVKNMGGVDSGALSFNLNGNDAAMFNIASDACSGTTLAPSQTCTLSVRFTPTALNLRSASLTVMAQPGGNGTASLTGTGSAPAILSSSPSTLSFGNFLVQTSSADIMFTVENVGQGPTNALSTNLSGSDAAFFAIANDNCTGKILMNGDTCTVAAHFVALAGTSGSRSAILNIVGAPGGNASSSLQAASNYAASCNNLGPECGPGGASDCCGTLLVPQGSVYRENHTALPVWQSSVGEYYLDAYEVSVSRFRRFVAAGGGTAAQPPAAGSGSYRYVSSGAYQTLAGSGWQSAWNSSLVADTAALKAALKCDGTLATWSDTPGSKENWPINCVNWFEAYAFCAWDGGFLPSEAQWFQAAAGGSDQLTYPWGSGLDSSHATYCAGSPCAGITPVGSKMVGNGKWGQADLVGNVWEWTLDWFSDPPPFPCADCALLSTATSAPHRTLWGAAFSSPAASLSLTGAGSRGDDEPQNRSYVYGLRCARPR